MFHVVQTKQKLIAMTSAREARPRTVLKFNPKTAGHGFGKVAKLHCSGLHVVCKSLSCVLWQRDNLMFIILKLFLLVPIILNLFIWYLLFSNYSGNNLPRPTCRHPQQQQARAVSELCFDYNGYH